MIINRIDKTNNYSVISNEFLRDKSLSYKAKGIMAYLLSLPDDWIIHINHLVAESKDGEDSFRSGLKELIKAGYVERYPIKDKGKFIRWEFEVYESLKLRENPQEEKKDIKISKDSKKLEGLNKKIEKESIDKAKAYFDEKIDQENNLLSKPALEKLDLGDDKLLENDDDFSDKAHQSAIDLLCDEINSKEKSNLKGPDTAKSNMAKTSLLSTYNKNTNNTKDLWENNSIATIEKMWNDQEATVPVTNIRANIKYTTDLMNLINSYSEENIRLAIKNTKKISQRRGHLINFAWFLDEDNFRSLVFGK